MTIESALMTESIASLSNDFAILVKDVSFALAKVTHLAHIT